MRPEMKNLTFSKVSLGLTALALLAVFGLAGYGGGGSDVGTPGPRPAMVFIKAALP